MTRNVLSAALCSNLLVLVFAFPAAAPAQLINFQSSVGVQAEGTRNAELVNSDNTSNKLSASTATATATAEYIYKRGDVQIRGNTYEVTTLTGNSEQSFDGNDGSYVDTLFAASLQPATDFEYQLQISLSSAANTGPSLHTDVAIRSVSDGAISFYDVNTITGHSGYLAAGGNYSFGANYSLSNDSGYFFNSQNYGPTSASETFTLTLIDLGTSAGPYPAAFAVPFPTVNNSPVPEPSSFVLTALGGIGLLFGVYRRRPAKGT